MSLDLPTPVATYFAAGSGNSEVLASCFTDNAVVQDEGHTYNGLAAIKQWRADTASQYNYTSEPFAAEEKDGGLVVTSKVSGNFPGSPVELRYIFGLEGGKIASLEIVS